MRERNFKSGTVAGWNTFAQIYDVYTAIHTVPESLGFLKNLWESEKDDDDGVKGKLFKIAIVLAILCIVGGILTTTLIIRATARNHAAQQYARAVNVQDSTAN